MTYFDSIVRGGMIQNYNGSEYADVGIVDGIIVAVGDLSDCCADRSVCAKDCYVIPGGIDPHTHIDSEYAGLRGGDSVHSGTLAAAYGGTTCLIDFAGGRGELTERLRKRHSEFEKEAVVDFGLHCVIGIEDRMRLQELEELSLEGVSSLKYYMNNDHPQSDGFLFHLLERAKQAGLLVCVHAENEQIIGFQTERLINSGRHHWKYFPDSRPPVSEEEAVSRAIILAESAQSGLYIVHISTSSATKNLENAYERGSPIYGETCPHYLLLDQTLYQGEEGDLYQVVPPLRNECDRETLWRALKKGFIQTLGSDHVSYTKEEKRRKLMHDESGKFIKNFSLVAAGLPGIELRLVTLLRGIQEGKISWQDLVLVNSYRPAQLFGLASKKGLLAAGYDADLIVLPTLVEQRTIKSSEDFHMKCDHTPYLGHRFSQGPKTVMVRGNLVISEGEYTGFIGGRYCMRSMDSQVLENNVFRGV